VWALILAAVVSIVRKTILREQKVEEEVIEDAAAHT
jgi:ABC-type proline/glycine betaine transport system permease subunit